MEIKKTDYIRYILKGLAVSYIITFAMILIISLLLTYTSLKESTIPIINTIAMIGSIVCGSIYLTLNTGEKGWLNGMLIGFLYFLILLILNKTFIKTFSFNTYSFSKLMISLVTGIIGGMIGINLK
ncbi:TIGR04086 family membrane protein [Sporanaerobacter acetigenes]|uniref:Putative membrane protein, TIGR04086 family n=1 Tax=Sporanaerobacter acetigenes DSM 13106 TaxID=1123281 RepID=A0A1M5XVP2_9FIRM|nr:TIGR04086 family membrane protein [Sporanaerobacter acetigenes]SHI03323.1 putative membrane protein, TIGR04086 family [Sporanaerobacter acetigenes DSM 13106]